METQESSSDPSSRCTYHVFLSFRGEDTRKNFTDHLYTALIQAGFHTFRDDGQIEKGHNIGFEIRRAIKESRASIIVFSKNYVSSRWCLDELVKIMERRRTAGHIVVPVFYLVNPSEVGTQTGSYSEAFAKHEANLLEDLGRVNGWRAALSEIAELEAMVLQDGYEAQFIQEIVKKVANQMNRMALHVGSFLVGIDSRIKDINAWLQDGSNGIDIATIYGIGGIGKTTIAKTVYNQNFDKFDSSSFLANVRETSEQYNGLIRLQRQLLSDILNRKANKIYSIDEGIIKIRDAVCWKRVLIIVDDVDQSDQFDAIIGMQDWLYRGSKVIITTRHEFLLRADEACVLKFKVEPLDDDESLQLFSWHAFGQFYPPEDYINHSKSVINHCGGLPLALQVLGSSLSGKSIDIWESALKKLKEILDDKIEKILRISYNSLQDDHDRNLFLDVACFFVGKRKDYMVRILDGCDFYAIAGLRNLIDRCLITIDDNDKLMMHQLLRDMGREIVRQESPYDLGKRSRLWRQKDVVTVLEENIGSETVKGLTLDMCMFKEDEFVRNVSNENYANQFPCEDSADNSVLSHQGNFSKQHLLSFFHRLPVKWVSGNSVDKINLKTKSFSAMNKLKLLQLNYVKLNGDYEHFPKGLVWLCWRGFPLKFIPSNLLLDKLAVLDMRNSSLINAWRGRRALKVLKILNLSHSYGLVRTPDFIGLPSLERLILKDCINLVEVHETIGYLERLAFLNLKDCTSLRELPKKMGMLKSLKELILSGCSKLGELPIEPSEMESLRLMDVDGTAVNMTWPLRFWCWLSPRRSSPTTCFSFSVLPQSLVKLNLGFCNILDDAFPKDLSCLSSLKILNLSGNPIHRLPESIKGLPLLMQLELSECERLQSFSELPTNLLFLNVSDCNSLQRVADLPNVFRSWYMDFCSDNKLVEIQDLTKSEPVAIADAETVESQEIVGMEMTNVMTSIGLHLPEKCCKCGISGIWVPGSEIPSWINHQDEGFPISFVVPSVLGYKISCLHLCISCVSDRTKFRIGAVWKQSRQVYIKNESKGLYWVHTSMPSPVDYMDEAKLWLTDWKFGEQLESGDQVKVFVDIESGIRVTRCGMHLEYEEERSYEAEGETSQSRSSSLWDRFVRNGDVGEFKLWQVAYVESDFPYPIRYFVLPYGLTSY